MINLRYLDICLQLLKHLRQIKNTMYYNGISNGPLEGINNKIKVIKRISYGYRFFTNFKGLFVKFGAWRKIGNEI